MGVEYSVGDKRRVTTSNVECICSPRYMIRKVELFPGDVLSRQLIGSHIGITQPGWVRERRMPDGRYRPRQGQRVCRPHPGRRSYIGKIGTSFFLGTSKPVVIGQVEGVRVAGRSSNRNNSRRIRCSARSPSPSSSIRTGQRQSGDIVTITIRYANTGAKAISDLVVSDTLSGRLEYIVGSAETDRPGNFTSAENEVGSVVVRWDLPGVLLPGQAGTVRFKAKVR